MKSTLKISSLIFSCVILLFLACSCVNKNQNSAQNDQVTIGDEEQQKYNNAIAKYAGYESQHSANLVGSWKVKSSTCNIDGITYNCEFSDFKFETKDDGTFVLSFLGPSLSDKDLDKIVDLRISKLSPSDKEAFDKEKEKFDSTHKEDQDSEFEENNEDGDESDNKYPLLTQIQKIDTNCTKTTENLEGIWIDNGSFLFAGYGNVLNFYDFTVGAGNTLSIDLGNVKVVLTK